MHTESDDSPISHEEADQGQDALSRQVLEDLIDQQRIQIEGIMLATDGDIPTEQVHRVIAAYRKHLDAHKAEGLSVKQAAKECGYSAAVLSEWGNGNYKGDVSAVTRRVNQWMERDARRRAAKRPSDYVTTGVAEAMGAFIQLADRQKVMAAIVAPSGVGKTKVLRHFCEQSNGIFVTCVPGMVAKHLYRKLAEELGWRRESGTRMELLNYVIGKLAGTNRIIFLDEASLLGKQIGSVRPLHDLAGVPIIMAGAAEILAAIDDDRQHGRGQMSSRTFRFDCLKAASRNGAPGRNAPAVLFSKDDIAKFFAMKRMRLTRDGIDMMWALANLSGGGALRLLSNVAAAILNAAPDIKAVGRRDIIDVLPLVSGDMADGQLRATDDHLELVAAPAMANVG